MLGATIVTDAEIKVRNRQPFSHMGGNTGVLLIHGFTGSPGELLPLGEFLATEGYAVEIPVLAGHCNRVIDMLRTTETDWIGSAMAAYDELAKRTKQVVVLGHSMGGLIAFYLANRFPVLGVVSICTPIYVTNRLFRIAPYLAWFKPVREYKEPRNQQIEQFLGGYHATPLAPVRNLQRLLTIVKGELPQVQVPTLILQAELDRTVRPKSAAYIYDKIGSTNKYLKWYAKSGHFLQVDLDHEQAFADILSFIQELERK